MKMCETGVKVEFEKKAFEQIRQNASQVLNSDDAPDVTEYNKGNATSGLLASQGLLTNLNDYVSRIWLGQDYHRFLGRHRQVR